MKAIETFVKQLFKRKFKNVEDDDAQAKLIEMLKEKVEDLKESGLDEKEAIHKAIVEFGELDDYYKPFADKEVRRYKRNKTIRHYTNDLLFSLIASALIIGILIFVNLYYIKPNVAGHWFVIPSLGILFWPAALLYKLLNKKGEK